MKNNRGIIVIIIIISVLVLALIGGIVFVAISQSKKNNNRVVVDAPTNSGENEQEKIDEFNEPFSGYEGEEISGTLVKSLLSAVILSNNSNENHQITVKILDTDLEEGTTDATDISKAQQEVKTTEIYEVEYNTEEGYISEITIEKTENTTVSPEVQRFNQKFTSYADETMKGKEIKENLAKLISESNKANPEHKISLHAGSIKSIKEIIDDAEYKIKLSYDDDGYLKRIDAEKQDENSNEEESNFNINNNQNNNNINNNSGDDSTQNIENQLNSIAQRTFNSNFTSYEGSGRKSSDVRALNSTVKNSNVSDPDHQVAIEVPEKLDSKKTYSIEIETGTDGYVSNIKVTEE